MSFIKKMLLLFFMSAVALFVSCSEHLEKKGKIVFRVNAPLVNQIKGSGLSLTGDYIFEIALSGDWNEIKAEPFMEQTVIKFEAVPVGAKIKVEASIYKTGDTDSTVLWYGLKEEYIVLEGENRIPLTMKKTQSGTIEPDPEPEPEPEPEVPEEVENKVGTISGNLFKNGNADGGESDERVPAVFSPESGCSYEEVEGGVDGTKCFKVTQGGTGTWQELSVDLTRFYGRGKSYLISFKAKADPDAGMNKSSGEPVRLYYTVVSGAVKDYMAQRGQQWYDYDDSGTDGIVSPWVGNFADSKTLSVLTSEKAPSNSHFIQTEPLSDVWTEYNFVIPATEIDRIVNNTGLYYFSFIPGMGENISGGYSYLLDDVVIKDLNSELPRTGRIYGGEDPEPKPDPEPEPEPEPENPEITMDIKNGLVSNVKSYWISDADGIKKLSELVNSGNSLAGYEFVVQNDIELNTKKVVQDGFIEPEEGEDCTPNSELVNFDSIGMRGAAFAGTFDGNGKVIDGFYAYQGHQGLGFIGATGAGAVVKNVILTNACIINSNASGELDAADDDRSGGLIGLVEGTTTIENCVFTGVVGSAAALARGGSYEYICGLIGRCDAATTAKNCIVFARFYANSGSGIINVKGSDSINLENTVGIDAATYTEGAYTGDNAYVLAAIELLNKRPLSPKGVPYAETEPGEVISGTKLQFFADLVVDNDHCANVYLQFVPEGESSTLTAENYAAVGTKYSKPITASESGTFYCIAEYNGLVSEVVSFAYTVISQRLLGMEAVNARLASLTHAEVTATADIKYGLIEAQGTEGEDDYVPAVKDYIVTDVAGLMKLSEIVNGKDAVGTEGEANYEAAVPANTLEGYTFTQVSDIQFNEKVLDDDFKAPAQASIGVPNADLVVFDGIGNKSKPFAGTYDGNNYVISGMYIYANHSQVGFIANSSGSTVLKNIILKDACVVASCIDDNTDDRVGGFIGKVTADGTIIENCVFVGAVGSDDYLTNGGCAEYHGGLIGDNNKKSTVVTDCVILVRITAKQNSDVICVKNKDNLVLTGVESYDASF